MQTIYKESNQRIAALPGLNLCYASKEARQALANADALSEGPKLSNNSTTVTKSSSLILKEDGARTYFLIQNLGIANVFINFGSDATVSNSLKLVPNESKEISVNAMACSEVNAISDGVDCDVAIFTTSY